MSFRCTGAFVYADRVYAGGCVVSDDDPILKTHAEYFAKVNESSAGGETATAAPAEVRAPAPEPEPKSEPEPKPVPEPEAEKPKPHTPRRPKGTN